MTLNLRLLIYVMFVLIAARAPIAAILSLYLPIAPYEITVLIFSVVLFCSVTWFFNLRYVHLSEVSFLNLALVVFLFLYFFRIVFDLGFTNSLTRSAPSEYIAYTFVSVIIPFVILTIASTLDVTRMLRWTAFCFMGLACLALNFSSELIGASVRELSVDDRFLGPLIIGYLGASSVVLAVGILVAETTNRAMFIIIFLGGISGIVLVGISGSRGPFLATAVPLVLYATRVLRLRAKGDWFVLACLLLLGSAVWSLGVFDGVTRRLDLMAQVGSLGGEARSETWSQGLMLVSSNLIFGIGAELPDGGRPHNLLLEAYLTTGVLGGTIMFVAFLFGLMKSVKEVLKGDVLLGMLHTSSSIAVCLSGTLFYSGFYFVTLALLLKKRKAGRPLHITASKPVTTGLPS